MRIGHGYDVHRITEGRKLILCGVNIPWDKGLMGHSDADVAVHALMDAILGAAAMGDIGHLFPDTDPAFAGADSIELLRTVTEKMSTAGYRFSNGDITILAQRPKLAPYIPDMIKNISEALSVDISSVNVKATTEERLGFTGRGEGISAHAVCIIEK